MRDELLLKYLNSLADLQMLTPVYIDQIDKVIKALNEELNIDN